MTKNTPDSAAINILREERLSDELLGVELQVKVKDFGGQPVPGWPFSINTGNQVLAKGATNESGEYRGQRVLQVRADAKMRIFLVLEGSAVTATKWVPDNSQKLSEPTVINDYPTGYKVVDCFEGGIVFSSSYSGYDLNEMIANLPRHPRLVEAFLLGYDPSRFRKTYKCLMNEGLLEEYLSKSLEAPVGELRRLVHVGNPFHADSTPIAQLSKREFDLQIDEWKKILLSREIKSAELSVKLRCVYLDLDRIKAVLTHERIGELLELDQAVGHRVPK